MASYNYMMSADEVAQELNCSKSHAYKLVKAMNKELAAQGYITMAGRIPKAFWAKKMYGYEILWVIRKNAESVDLKQSENNPYGHLL